MFRYVIVATLLLAVWLHWRAAYTAAVRAAVDDLPGHQEQLDELIFDLRDKRLAFRCKAMLADYRAGRTELCREHMGDVLERVEHLERFAPLRRLIPRPK